MGLFSRKEAASSTRRRTAAPSEAHAEDLRGRARQRLIGALVLVVAAVVIVPLLLKNEPDVQPETPVVVPAVPPIPEPLLAANDPLQAGSDAGLEEQLSVETPALPVPEPIAQPPAEQTATAKPAEPPAKPEPEAKPEPKPEPKPAPKPEPKPSVAQRTDDGSVAIALLEGRQPSSPPPAAARGNFVVQIAAYTSQQDAQARRDSLVSSGVTNAYVETANPDGKTTYRLRVGPFQTREAAQAAQTRLRSLDYVNSFIATQ